MAEITLALLLFADASTIRLRDAEGDALLPGRLLGVGLPLTIALGTVVARVVLPVNWAVAGLIGSILAPTDVALGLAVVTNPAVPARVRRALNIESGLNDGIATPFVIFFLTVAVAEEVHQHWVAGTLRDVLLAVVFGAALGPPRRGRRTPCPRRAIGPRPCPTRWWSPPPPCLPTRARWPCRPTALSLRSSPASCSASAPRRIA